jgi:hypothetical protein
VLRLVFDTAALHFQNTLLAANTAIEAGPAGEVEHPSCTVVDPH